MRVRGTYLVDNQVGESEEVATQSSRMCDNLFSLEERIEDEFGRWKLVGGERVGSLNASSVCRARLMSMLSDAVLRGVKLHPTNLAHVLVPKRSPRTICGAVTMLTANNSLRRMRKVL